MADLSAGFRKPFGEQVAAWRIRMADLVPTARWDDLWQEQHDRAFMVAGAVKADLLADLASAVDRAIADGTGFEAFRKDFRAIVQRRGWHGWTGEGTVRGEEWRMRTIYRTNMRTSYMAGRHAQLLDGGYSFWVYRHSGAAHPRLDHLSWNGVALPPDHPFWQTYYPPNGWGCGCLVSGARSARGIRRVGGDPGKALPDGWQAVDPRTGAPKGVGRGWAYLQARQGTIARALVWFAARNRATGDTETMGLWSGADHEVFAIEGEERLYYGAGNLVELPRLTSQAGLTVRMHRIALASMTGEVAQLIRGYDVRFAPVQIHRALFRPEGGGLVDEPHRVFRGHVDAVDFSRGAAGEAAVCELTLATTARNLTRSVPQKKSDATQKLRAGDRFRRYGDVSGSVNIYWGEARVAAPSEPSS